MDTVTIRELRNRGGEVVDRVEAGERLTVTRDGRPVARPLVWEFQADTAVYGINDEFIKNLGKTIPKGTSALFLLIRRSTPDKVLPEIEPYRPRVIKTSLSGEQEEKLKAALSGVAKAA